MNRLVDAVRNIAAESNGKVHSKPSSSRIREPKRKGERKSNKKPTNPHQTHFYDPHAPEESSSSDGPGLSELNRRHTDTMTRIEEAEAALAKERKRIEQLELRKKDVEARGEQRRNQQDDDAGLSPREKNRGAFEREVAKVQRNAKRKIEELERRFAHSDKVFELNMAR
jgi:hypothetical protein